MDKPRGTWFWILIILIFVLYCIAWRRPFCATLEGQMTAPPPPSPSATAKPFPTDGSSGGIAIR